MSPSKAPVETGLVQTLIFNWVVRKFIPNFDVNSKMLIGIVLKKESKVIYMGISQLCLLKL